MAYQLLGVIAFRKGDLEAAIELFSAVIANDPSNWDGYNNLGNVLCDAGRDLEAVDRLRRAVELNPGLSAAHSNLCRALASVGQIEEALEAGKQAVALDPQRPEPYLNLGTALLDCGAVREAVEYYGKAMELAPGDRNAQSNQLMALQYSADRSSQELYEAALAWGRSMPAQRPWPLHTDPEPERLKIGYVSGDLRTHPVGYAMEPILRDHDRSRVEVFCYTNAAGEDEVSARLKAHSDAWRKIAGLDDLGAAEQIRADGIHVLVDLSGHTAQNRLGVFALKPAPVQATWLGYFATTGLSQMDFILRDEPQIPAGERAYYVEQVWPLKGGGFSFDAGPEALPISLVPAKRKGHITFGCFNTLAKISGPSIQAWAAILHAVPGSVLMLNRKPFKDQAVRSLFERAFANHGIGAERLRLGASSGREAYFKLYEEVDIMLDTFPFNGGSTTYEALWMGVPVVSHRWDRMVGHFGESILAGCGHPEWIARKESEMVRIAMSLAGGLGRLEVLRRTLREELASSALCRSDICVRGLEEAYFGMWESVGKAEGKAA